MFNLIVAVISIALIAAMAAASIFYGGSAFGSGTAQAQASTLVNNGQQVSGAQQLYMIDNSGNRANDIDVLTPAYLQALPTAPSNSTGASATDTGAWEISDDGTFAYIPLNTAHAGANTSPADTVCQEIVAQGGLQLDSAATTLGTATVLGSGAGEINLGDDQFGCVVDGTDSISDDGATAHFVFKL